MSTRLLKPQTYDGNGLTNIGRTAWLDYGDGSYDTPSFSPQNAERIAGFPSYVRMQPGGKTLPLHFTVKTKDTEGQFRRLGIMFDPAGDLRYLVAADCNGGLRRLLCVAQQLILEDRSPAVITAPMWAPYPYWEDNTASTETSRLAAINNPHSFTKSNVGSAIAYPTMTMIPISERTAAQAYTRTMEISYANRSEYSLTGPASGTWLIELVPGGWDTATLVGTGEIANADGRDIAVFVDGIQVPEEKVNLVAMNTAATKVWIEIADGPANYSPLRDAIVAGSLALFFQTAEHGFSVGDYLVWQNNASFYEEAKVTAVEGNEVVVTRGMRNTTAGAASVGRNIYRSGHHIQLAWGRSGLSSRPTNPNPPLINTSTSTNLKWDWTPSSAPFDPVWADNNRRPGGWRRMLYEGRDDVLELKKNRLSAKTSLISFLNVPTFFDVEPSATRPNYDALEFKACCGVDTTLGAIEYNASIGWPFALQIIGRDIFGLDTLVATRLGHELAAAHFFPVIYTNQQETPLNILQTVILRCRQSIVTTCRPTDTTEVTLVPPTTTNAYLQGFKFDEITRLDAIISRDRHSVAGTSSLSFSIHYPASVGGDFSAQLGVGPRIAGPFSGAGGLGAAFRQSCTHPSPAAAFTTDVPTFAAGDYFLSVGTVAGTGTIKHPASTSSIYPLGDAWQFNGLTYVQVGTLDLWFALLSLTADNQEDALVAERTGEITNLDNITIVFDPNRTPIVDPRPAEDAYYMETNWQRVANNENLTVKYLQRWVDAQNNPITIDVFARTVTDVGKNENIRQTLTVDTEPWLTLEPGSNTIVANSVGGAVGEDVTLSYRNTWQA